MACRAAGGGICSLFQIAIIIVVNFLYCVAAAAVSSASAVALLCALFSSKLRHYFFIHIISVLCLITRIAIPFFLMCLILMIYTLLTYKLCVTHRKKGL